MSESHAENQTISIQMCNTVPTWRQVHTRPNQTKKNTENVKETHHSPFEKLARLFTSFTVFSSSLQIKIVAVTFVKITRKHLRRSALGWLYALYLAWNNNLWWCPRLWLAEGHVASDKVPSSPARTGAEQNKMAACVWWSWHGRQVITRYCGALPHLSAPKPVYSNSDNSFRQVQLWMDASNFRLRAQVSKFHHGAQYEYSWCMTGMPWVWRS